MEFSFDELYQKLSGYGITVKLPLGPTGKLLQEATIGDIISALLPYVFVLAGLILFVFLIFGGFELMTSAGDPKKMESAQGKITSAVIGFVIIFVAYWLVQILQIVFGITILG